MPPKRRKAKLPPTPEPKLPPESHVTPCPSCDDSEIDDEPVDDNKQKTKTKQNPDSRSRKRKASTLDDQQNEEDVNPTKKSRKNSASTSKKNQNEDGEERKNQRSKTTLKTGDKMSLGYTDWEINRFVRTSHTTKGPITPEWMKNTQHPDILKVLKGRENYEDLKRERMPIYWFFNKHRKNEKNKNFHSWAVDYDMISDDSDDDDTREDYLKLRLHKYKQKLDEKNKLLIEKEESLKEAHVKICELMAELHARKEDKDQLKNVNVSLQKLHKTEIFEKTNNWDVDVDTNNNDDTPSVSTQKKTAYTSRETKAKKQDKVSQKAVSTDSKMNKKKNNKTLDDTAAMKKGKRHSKNSRTKKEKIPFTEMSFSDEDSDQSDNLVASLISIESEDDEDTTGKKVHSLTSKNEPLCRSRSNGKDKGKGKGKGKSSKVSKVEKVYSSGSEGGPEDNDIIPSQDLDISDDGDKLSENMESVITSVIDKLIDDVLEDQNSVVEDLLDSIIDSVVECTISSDVHDAVDVFDNDIPACQKDSENSGLMRPDSSDSESEKDPSPSPIKKIKLTKAAVKHYSESSESSESSSSNNVKVTKPKSSQKSIIKKKQTEQQKPSTKPKSSQKKSMNNNNNAKEPPKPSTSKRIVQAPAKPVRKAYVRAPKTSARKVSLMKASAAAEERQKMERENEEKMLCNQNILKENEKKTLSSSVSLPKIPKIPKSKTPNQENKLKLVDLSSQLFPSGSDSASKKSPKKNQMKDRLTQKTGDGKKKTEKKDKKQKEKEDNEDKEVKKDKKHKKDKNEDKKVKKNKKHKKDKNKEKEKKGKTSCPICELVPCICRIDEEGIQVVEPHPDFD